MTRRLDRVYNASPAHPIMPTDPSYLLRGALLVLAWIAASTTSMAEPPKLNIAHRGASGYLPEHTLEAKALAIGMGADFVEQDVVLTRDDQLIVVHDIHLDTVTDVKKRFPDRAREDGRYYALDFDLDEIQSLRATERVDPQTGKAVYPRRFPPHTGTFRIPSLAEEIALVQGFNRAKNRNIGLFLEIKHPAWHQEQGRDISKLTLAALKEYGYEKLDDAIVIQCFDADELKRIRGQLKCRMRLCQLIGGGSEQMRSADGIRAIAKYAHSIGPELSHVLLGRDDEDRFVFSELVDLAHSNNLKVYPYTLRADQLPKYADNFEELVDLIFNRADADGAFTDFPDRVSRVLRR